MRALKKKWKLPIFIFVVLSTAAPAIWKRSSALTRTMQQQRQQEAPPQIISKKAQQQKQKADGALNLPVFHMVLSSFKGDEDAALSTLNMRSIESIFYFHPTARVHLYTNQDTGLKSGTRHPKLAPLVRQGYNISVIPYQPEQVLKEAMTMPGSEINRTLAQDFLTLMPARKEEKYWYSNEANVLRLCLLYTQGGIYFDTDVILISRVLASHPKLDNVMGRHSDGRKFHNAAMKFTTLRNRFLAATLNNMMENFDGLKWGNNGPKAFGRTARAHPEMICDEDKYDYLHEISTNSESQDRRSIDKKTNSTSTNECWVNPLPNEAFAPVSHKHWKEVCGLHSSSNEESEKENSITPTYEEAQLLVTNSYVVHLNNKITGESIRRKGYAKGSLCDVVLSNYCVLCE